MTDIRYKRWKNKRHGYLVEILDVQNYPGGQTCYQTVRVKRVRSHEERTWAVEAFLKSFDPIGRKMRQKTAWDRLQ